MPKTEIKNPKVVVIMPVYNGSNYMREAIDSALNQTYKNVEVVVINDGSTDGGKTDTIAKSYGDKIKYFVKENGGVSSALNFGIKYIQDNYKDAYFCWLSHDDKYTPEKIEKEVKALKGHNKTTVVFSNFSLFDDKGTIFAATHSEERIKEDQFKGIYPVLKGMVNGDTILVHQDVFNKCGYFDEVNTNAADYRMWLKVFAEFDHVFLKEPLSLYRIHDQQDTVKSPTYNEESDNFWLTAIDEIDDKKAKSWGVTLFKLYADLYIQMKNAGFNKAAEKAYDLAKKRFTKDQPSVSVLMPSYNSEKYLESSVNSLLSSDLGDFELIIIDDNSSDNTVKVAESLAEKDFRIKVIKNPRNEGVAVSLNTGLDKMRGKYITRLDSDDTMLPSRLLKQFLLLESGKYDFCATNINLIHENGNLFSTKTYRKTFAPARFLAVFTNPVPNATIMYRADIINKNHLRFDNHTVAEDYCFLLSYLKYGDGTMIDEGLYNYRIREDSLFHDNLGSALEKSFEFCKDYAKTTYKDIADSYTFNSINSFKKTAEIKTDDDKYAAITDSEKIIAAFAKKYRFTEEEINGCRVFVFNSLEDVIPNRHHVKRGPLGKAYHYYLDNGMKKTLVKIVTLGKK